MFSHSSKRESITVDEIYTLFKRDPQLAARNKEWLKNKLTPLKYYGFVEPIRSLEGRIIEVKLTRKGRDAIDNLNNSLLSQSSSDALVLNDSVGHTRLSDSSFTYSLPLLSGEVVSLNLPVKLSKEDANRIAAFVEGLVLDPKVRAKELEI